MTGAQGQQGGQSLRQRAERLAQDLRERAEARLPFERMDIAELLHELSVYQIELEVQREDLRQSQRQLMQARDRYARLYDFAPVGYVKLNTSGVIKSANLAFASLVQIERASLVGQRFADLVAAESQDDLHRHLMAVFAGSFKQTCELEMKAAAGRLLHVYIESITDELDGEIRGCRTSVTDITQLQGARLVLNKLTRHLDAQVAARTAELGRANRALQAEITQRMASANELARVNAFNRALFDTAQTIVLVLDPEGQVVYFNRCFEELCGYSLAEMRGKDWFAAFIPDRDRARCRQMFATVASGTATWGDVNPIVTRYGERRFIEWYDAPLNAGNGEFRGLLCTGQDVTERKILQERLLNIAEQEQQRIGQQLHDDLGQELVALKLTMDTMVEHLRDADSAEEERATRVTDGLISALRKVRELSKGLIPYPVSAENFATEMRALCNLYPRIDCRCECDPEAVPSDDGVAVQLYYIAREALTNAVKRCVGVDLQVVVSMRVADHRMVLSVRDNGSGVEQANRYTGDSGLRIMQYRAELIGAEFSIESPPGGGTVVSCALPIR